MGFAAIELMVMFEGSLLSMRGWLLDGCFEVELLPWGCGNNGMAFWVVVVG